MVGGQAVDTLSVDAVYFSQYGTDLDGYAFDDSFTDVVLTHDIDNLPVEKMCDGRCYTPLDNLLLDMVEGH